MYISDMIFSSIVSSWTKERVLELIERESIGADLPVLKPTASNDDINGSQHASGGGTDFSYEDATEDDAASASSLGYYEYFADSLSGGYTGHYYQGSDRKFAAIVIDPPAYAATVQV